VKTVQLWILAVVFLSHPAIAGNVRVCRDASGNVTFTQSSCPKNSKGRNIYVPLAQSPISKLRAGEVMELNRVRQVNRSRHQPQQQSKPTVRRSCSRTR